MSALLFDLVCTRPTGTLSVGDISLEHNSKKNGRLLFHIFFKRANNSSLQTSPKTSFMLETNSYLEKDHVDRNRFLFSQGKSFTIIL